VAFIRLAEKVEGTFLALSGIESGRIGEVNET
jgi:hypothetical protein